MTLDFTISCYSIGSIQDLRCPLDILFYIPTMDSQREVSEMVGNETFKCSHCRGMEEVVHLPLSLCVLLRAFALLGLKIITMRRFSTKGHRRV
jgi:hypothetical protein